MVAVEDSPLSEQGNDEEIVREEDREGPDAAAEPFSGENFLGGSLLCSKVTKVCLNMPTELQNCVFLVCV